MIPRIIPVIKIYFIVFLIIFLFTILLIYSALNASTGLIELAFRAGINPAKAPATIKTINALTAILISIVGLLNIGTSLPIKEFMPSNNNILLHNPTIPAIAVRKTDSSMILEIT